MFKRFDNAGVAVSDLARARLFYEGVLGLPWTGDESGATVAVGGVSLYVFATGGPPGPARSAELFSNPVGIDHLAFEADDFDADVAELTRRGVSWLSETVGEPGGFRYRGFRDPDGNCLYLIELGG